MIDQALEPEVGEAEAIEGDGVVALEVEVDPEEQARLQEEAAKKREEMLVRLDAMGQSLAKTRAEAISARQSSGIELEWYEDEEFYQGIDDANRNERRTIWRTKPPGLAAETAPATTRSTVFPNITGPYTDAASARIADMLLPTDDRSWALAPTPVPELLNISKGKVPRPMVRQAAQMHPGDPQAAKQVLTDAVQQALAELEEAKEKADKAQKRIEDWHVECQWHAQVRLVIEDSARIGVGVLKGPVPMQKQILAYKDGRIIVSKEIKPGSKWIDPWNFYPAADCGENIHSGSYTWERDYLTKKQLRELIGQQDYIDEQITKCLEEGAQRATADYKETPDPVSDTDPFLNKFEVWYFHGTAERDDLEAAGCDCGDEADPHVPAMIVMVNNRVIKAVMNPLDTGSFPYDVMVWRRRSGHWAGIGVARQIRVAQRIVTAATRNLMDNAGIAAGPMLVLLEGVTPADGVLSIGPRRVWRVAEDAQEIGDAMKAVGVVKVDMLVNELMEIIQLGLKLAEDVTGLPMLLQGQMGKAPDTVGGMTMLNNNASAVLRRLARLFDDRITEPHVRRYYNWLLQYGEDDEKGDYCVDARGSSALVERDLQNQAIAQMANLVLDPRFGKDPKKWMDEFLKSQRLDAKRFNYDDEKWQQIIENMSKGQQDPRLAVAELRAQVDERLLQMTQSWESAENERDRQLDLLLAGLEADIEKRRQAGDREISLADLKGMLAGKVIDFKGKRQLFNDEKRLKLATGSGI